LETAGMEIREAGTKSRPSSSQFEFHPSPTSPIYNKFHRKSVDSFASLRINRDSYMSTRTTRSRPSMDRSTQTEMGTQTDEYLTPVTSPTHSSFDHALIVEEDEKQMMNEPEEIDYTKIDLGPYSGFNHSQEFDGTTMNNSPRQQTHDDIDTHTADSSFATEDDLEDEEEPVVYEAASAQATVISPQSVKTRGPALVNIAKRPPPPPLPPRNTARSSRHMVDQASGQSPMKEEFEEVDLYGGKGEEQRRSSIPEKTIGLGIAHLEKEEPVMEPSVSKKVEIPAVEPAHKTAEIMTVVGAFPKEDNFHILPVSPMEGVQAN